MFGVRSPSPFVCLLLLLCVCVSFVRVSGQTDAITFKASVDQVGARTARVRFLYSATTTITATLVQYSNAALPSPSTFHSRIVNGPIVTDDHEIGLAQGSLPVTSAILRNLLPSTTYHVQIAYNDSQTPPQVQAAAATDTQFTTTALSSNVLLNSLYASGGCGQLTSTGQLYYLTSVNDGTNIIYSCTVVAETSQLSLAIIPQHAYASINTATTPALSTYNATTVVTSPYVDPLTVYNTTLTLGAQGSVTNFTWVVTAENGSTQSYILSITRAVPTSTAQVTGPSSPVTALIKSPSTATVFNYRALLWQSTNANFWKVWSDDLVVFPFTSFNISFPSALPSGGADLSYAAVSVTPAAANSPDGACSNVNVAVFDQLGRSSWITTCISALDDSCSPTPFGAATYWQSPFGTNGAVQSNAQIWFPAPPLPWFPTTA